LQHGRSAPSATRRVVVRPRRQFGASLVVLASRVRSSTSGRARNSVLQNSSRRSGIKAVCRVDRGSRKLVSGLTASSRLSPVRTRECTMKPAQAMCLFEAENDIY
jgi:hypothetical protein